MIGIDTIRVITPTFEISKHANILISGESTVQGVDNNAIPLFDVEGETYQGRKAYFNNEFVNMEVLHGFSGINAFIHFSIPKVSGKQNNFELVDCAGTKKAVIEVEKILRDNGIKVNLFNGTISRLDLCRNIITDHNYREYDNILNHLNMKRGNKKDLGNKVDTHLWKNSQQEICIYDKFKEMLCKKHDISSVQRNTIRCELRLMKSKKIQKEFPHDNLHDIIDNYESVMDLYKVKMKDNIFKYDVKEFEIKIKEKVISELQYFESHYKRNRVDEFIKCYGVVMIDKMIGWNVFELALKETGHKRNSLHYVKNKFNKKLFENSMFVNTTNPMELYNELKYKICA